MYIVGRLAGGIFTVFIVSIFVFLMMRLIPGDPADVLLGHQYTAAVAHSLRLRYGLTGSLPSQYAEWARAALHGDLGVSFITNQPVTAQLGARIIRTLELLAGGLVIAMAIAIPSGILAARRRGRLPDAAVLSYTSLMLSIPQFVVGILLIFVFAVAAHLLPAGGWVDPSTSFSGWLQSMILPWLTIGLTVSAFTSRVLRAGILDAGSSGYVTTARSWGLSEGQIVRSHVLKNAAIPTITVVGLEVGYLLGGAIVVETVFAYPGMGQLIVNAIANRDYPVVQAAIMVFAVGFVLINLLVDLVTAIVDPRIRVW